MGAQADPCVTAPVLNALIKEVFQLSSLHAIILQRQRRIGLPFAKSSQEEFGQVMQGNLSGKSGDTELKAGNAGKRSSAGPGPPLVSVVFSMVCDCGSGIAVPSWRRLIERICTDCWYQSRAAARATFTSSPLVLFGRFPVKSPKRSADVSPRST
eukprot:755080-Hanusia_phi.AAC.1